MFRPWEEKRARLSAAECQSRSAQGVGSATTVLSAPSATALQSLRSQSAARAGGPSRWRAMDEHRQGISSAGAHSDRCQGDPSYSASSYSSAKAVKQERKNLTINEVAKWLLIVGGSMAEILGVAPWLREFHAEIESYRDPPKSLEELQDAVSRPHARKSGAHPNLEASPDKWLVWPKEPRISSQSEAAYSGMDLGAATGVWAQGTD